MIWSSTCLRISAHAGGLLRQLRLDLLPADVEFAFQHDVVVDHRHYLVDGHGLGQRGGSDEVHRKRGHIST